MLVSTTVVSTRIRRPPTNLVLHCDRDHAAVQILDYVRADHLPEASQCFRIRNLLSTDAGERSVHQIGPDFPLQYLVAPVADVLEDEKPKHYLGRCLPPP